MRQHKYPLYKPKGFTLIEVLVAMSIFSVIGLGATQMLRTVIKTHERTQAIIADIAEFTKAGIVIERDFEQLVNRSIRNEYGDMSQPLLINSNSYLIELTRAGWRNPLNSNRSELQRVAYSLDAQGDLTRLFWRVLDRAEDSQPIIQTLLHNIDEIRVKVLDKNGDSFNTWPQNREKLIPTAVEIVIVSKRMGEVRKLIPFIAQFSGGANTSNTLDGAGGQNPTGNKLESGINGQ